MTPRIPKPHLRQFASSSRQLRKSLPLGPSTQSSRERQLAKALHRMEMQSLPSAPAYNKVLQAVGWSSLPENPQESLPLDVAKAILEEARNRSVELGEEGMSYLADIGFRYPHILPSILIEAANKGIYPVALFEALAKLSSRPTQPEQFIFLVNEMLGRGLEPSRDFVRSTVRACCEWGMPRLAIDIVEKLNETSSTGQIVDWTCWTDILISSAENQYLDGTRTAWNKVQGLKSFTMDEGLLLKVLDVAARWGDPDLASEALAAISAVSSAQEHHLTALMESYVAAGRVPEALQVVNLIRTNGLEPTLSSVEPIAAALTTTEIVDQAFYGLEDMHKEGQKVDIAAINAVILASARLADLRRVRATQAAIEQFGLKPNLDTFNLALEGCLNAKHRPLADNIMAEMEAAGIKPDQTTYERMIRLCLIPRTYEDAFYYLETMKADGIKPSSSIYNALLKRCAEQQDKRWMLVKEEMSDLGYKIQRGVMRVLDGGRQERNTEREQDGE